MTTHSEIGAHLPLQQAQFHILVALSDGENHGYAILASIDERTGGAVRLSAGTLYRNLDQMEELGLITEARKRVRSAEGPPRRLYRISELGRAVVRAEVSRLASLVRIARAAGVTPMPAAL